MKYNQFVEDLAGGVHNLKTGGNTLKVILSNAAPNVATHNVRGDVTELSTGGGYTSGGVTVGAITGAESGGTFTLTEASDPVFTASGGTIGPFRYAILYNDTPTSPADPLIAYWDYGSSITLQDGETFTVNLTGILQIT